MGRDRRPGRNGAVVLHCYLCQAAIRRGPRLVRAYGRYKGNPICGKCIGRIASARSRSHSGH